jgi:hypothetical protein
MMYTANEVNLLCSTGKLILSSLHTFNVKKGLDDTEYLPVVKAAISGIKTQAVLLELPSDEINNIVREMIEHCKISYIEFWLSNEDKIGDGDGDKELASQEGVYYFDHIYEHEKLPS